ncbi:MAG: hypothetical protein AABP62_18935 [Planctomycetota bacterium]
MRYLRLSPGPPGLLAVAVSTILVIHSGLLVWSTTVHSPNVNEPSHLAAGISHWQFGRYELYRVNPPLVRMVAAVPVLAVGAKTDWSNFHDSPLTRSEFMVGPDFVAANGERSLWLTTIARWACIPFSLVGGWVCFLWGRALYGKLAGLLSLTLWCFSPDILGHASCFTPDAHAAAVGLAGNYFFWRWLKQPSWKLATATGIVLGLALLTKITWLVLFALWPVLWMTWHLMGPRDVDRSKALSLMNCLQLAVIFLLGIHILNMGYQYDGTFRRLGDYQFISHALSQTEHGIAGNRFCGTLLAALPVPLPAQFVIGADVQKQDFERHPVSYFRGKTYRHGFWYFYLYALAIKIPLGLWMLAITAALFELTRRERLCQWRDELILLAPFFTILAFASSETDYTTHFRYVLPILPYALIWIGQVGAALSRQALWTPVVFTGLAWSICNTLWYSPHWLSYFNESVGGPLHGHEHLANSNVDWGQDLLYLRDWLKVHPEAQPIGLAYYGMFHPRSIGIEFEDVPGWITEPEELADSEAARDDPLNVGPRAGWYAVSANFLVGHPFWNYRPDGARGWFDRAYFTWFQHLQPVARAGYSIHIFHVTEADVRNLRQRSSQAADSVRPSIP